jgi:hypothetical protein
MKISRRFGKHLLQRGAKALTIFTAYLDITRIVNETRLVAQDMPLTMHRGLTVNLSALSGRHVRPSTKEISLGNESENSTPERYVSGHRPSPVQKRIWNNPDGRFTVLLNRNSFKCWILIKFIRALTSDLLSCEELLGAPLALPASPDGFETRHS